MDDINLGGKSLEDLRYIAKMMGLKNINRLNKRSNNRERYSKQAKCRRK